MSETVCADCPQCGHVRATTLPPTRKVTSGPIWIPIGDVYAEHMADLALTDGPDRVLLGEDGAWLSAGTCHAPCAVFEHDTVKVVHFQATDPVVRWAIASKYSKKEIETLVARTLSNGVFAAADGTLKIYLDDMASLYKHPACC
jgi:hypothetical protein